MLPKLQGSGFSLGGPFFPLSISFFYSHWIGKKNYLGEMTRAEERTRGANCTSADAAVLFKKRDGRKRIDLIEWKFTESYTKTKLHKSKGGTDRMKIYERLFETDGGGLDPAKVPSFSDLFYDPFYQLMRQQFLALEMERARELGADEVGVVHISPRANTDFSLNITSRNLRSLGRSVTEVWSNLVRRADTFTGVHTEDLFRHLRDRLGTKWRDWLEYQEQRYQWSGAEPA